MNETRHTDFDVLIVGAGMVGAAMALSLAGSAWRVGLLDRGSPQASRPQIGADRFDARVSALTAASGDLLKRLQVWPRIAQQRCCPYQHMRVWEEDGTGSIHFNAADMDATELGTIVENSVVMAAMWEKLGEMSNLSVLSEQELTGLELPEGNSTAPVVAETASGQILSASLVIAADGANSPTREMAKLATRDWDYGHHAIVTTARTEAPHQHTAWQRFLSSGPLAFLPLLPAAGSNEQHYCSIVWSVDSGRAEQLMDLDDEAFARRLGDAFEFRLGEIEHCDRRFSFKLRQCHGKEYVKPGLALIGDAAHSIHPLAGQGVNLGLLDVVALNDQLSQARGKSRRPGDSVLLRRYQRDRIGHNLSMMWAMEGFKRTFESQSLPLRWLRNAGLDRVDRTGVFKNLLARKAMGLS